MADLATDRPDGSGVQELRRRLKKIEDDLAFLRSSQDVVGRASVEGTRRSLRLRGGGAIITEYLDGAIAGYFGRFIRDFDGSLASGYLVVDHNGSSIFAAYCNDDPADRGVVDADAEFIGLEGYTQVFINSGDDNFIEMTPTNIWIQHDNPAGAPNFIAVDANGITLQAVTGTHTMPGMGSTGNSPNLWIDVTSGDVKRSTSSRRYKQDIVEAEVDVAEVLALVPRRFRMIEEVEELGAAAPTYVGFIAEDAHDLGLTDWVTYDAEGRPEAFDYATFCVAQQAVLQDQELRIRALESADEAAADA